MLVLEIMLDIIEFIAIIYVMVWLWKQAWVRKTIHFFLKVVSYNHEREVYGWW